MGRARPHNFRVGGQSPRSRTEISSVVETYADSIGVKAHVFFDWHWVHRCSC